MFGALNWEVIVNFFCFKACLFTRFKVSKQDFGRLKYILLFFNPRNSRIHVECPLERVKLTSKCICKIWIALRPSSAGQTLSCKVLEAVLPQNFPTLLSSEAPLLIWALCSPLLSLLVENKNDLDRYNPLPNGSKRQRKLMQLRKVISLAKHLSNTRLVNNFWLVNWHRTTSTDQSKKGLESDVFSPSPLIEGHRSGKFITPSFPCFAFWHFFFFRWKLCLYRQIFDSEILNDPLLDKGLILSSPAFAVANNKLSRARHAWSEWNRYLPPDTPPTLPQN